LSIVSIRDGCVSLRSHSYILYIMTLGMSLPRPCDGLCNVESWEPLNATFSTNEESPAGISERLNAIASTNEQVLAAESSLRRLLH